MATAPFFFFFTYFIFPIGTKYITSNFTPSYIIFKIKGYTPLKRGDDLLFFLGFEKEKTPL